MVRSTHWCGSSWLHICHAVNACGNLHMTDFKFLISSQLGNCTVHLNVELTDSTEGFQLSYAAVTSLTLSKVTIKVPITTYNTPCQKMHIAVVHKFRFYNILHKNFDFQVFIQGNVNRFCNFQNLHNSTTFELFLMAITSIHGYIIYMMFNQMSNWLCLLQKLP